MNSNVVGSNIKKIRTFQGKKQEVFAKEIGVSRVMLSRYENGRSAIKVDLLNIISNKLKTPVVELMQDSI